MKTIEILSNGRQVQFTTKSVTIAGTEYLYSHISELRHSEAKHVYGFKCDDEVVMLPYDAKDALVLKAIFSQVQQMHRKPVAAESPAKAGVPGDSGAEAPAETAADHPAETPADEAPALTAKEKKRLEKEQRKADKAAARREKQAQKAAAKSGGTDAGSEPSDQIDPAQKSARFKKAIIIFVVILAVFALLGIAYYFLIGPSSDPQIGPNTTDQTQYNDIDDMINDLEN